MQQFVGSMHPYVAGFTGSAAIGDSEDPPPPGYVREFVHGEFDRVRFEASRAPLRAGIEQAQRAVVTPIRIGASDLPAHIRFVGEPFMDSRACCGC